MFLGHLEERFNTIEEKVAAILFHVSVISQVDLTIKDLEERIRELVDQIKTLESRVNAHLVATIDYEMGGQNNELHSCGICEDVEFKQDEDQSALNKKFHNTKNQLSADLRSR